MYDTLKGEKWKVNNRGLAFMKNSLREETTTNSPWLRESGGKHCQPGIPSLATAIHERLGGHVPSRPVWGGLVCHLGTFWGKFLFTC